MIFFITILALFNCILAFEPSCSSCKFYIPSKTSNPELGFCRMFKNTCYQKGAQVLLPNYAQHCRENEHLCGKSGFLYEANNDITKEMNKQLVEEPDIEIINELNEINNRCCGEVNENNEIEQLEKDFFDILQRIKKHNKKRIYNSSKDLYKLFKRDK